MKKNILLFAFICFSFLLNAQDFTSTINDYFSENRVRYGLNAQDVSDIHVHSQHYSSSTRVNHVYLVQRYQGIEIFNAVANFAISNDNTVRNAAFDFIPQVSQKANTLSPGLTPDQAIYQAAAQLGLNAPSGLELIESPEVNKYIYNNGNISQENINVKLVFQPNQEKTALRLAWDLDIFFLDSSHWYSIRIDANTGQLLDKNDWGDHCNFGETQITEHNITDARLHQKSILEYTASNFISPNDGSQYRVFAMPNESPNHGPATLESEPADPIASPFGWHDTNGVPGPEFTTTRGNNVRARADLAGNNQGASAEGGSNLNFDFPFEFNQHPVGYVDGSTTNLFYWNNIIHDVFYRYGFDEASGNFQETNYTGQGLGNDSVNADAQDGGGINNATFFTPPEGSRPRMEMYLWYPQDPLSPPLTINNGSLAGSYSGLGAQFGLPIPSVSPLTADLALAVDDNSGVSIDPYDACDNITNGAALNGKIVVVRRGECEFGFKVLAAQNQGAVAVIVVNNIPDDPIAMGPGDVGESVTIPSLMVDQADGEAIITALENGNTINATLYDAGPYMIDGTLDNGIIAHEYGHGISNRLTGGAFNSGCLNSLIQVEQMGEGWSDWIGLMLTMKEGDTPQQPRGIGTYIREQPTNGPGIRPARYSTSFAVNSFTYGNTNNPGLSIPHGIGFVWATMLWDLTWALVDEYGFDPDFYSGTGGNNIAIQLVIDGMKLQVCNPGFVDGRNAILLADELANEGANKCLIWNVFANRGLGVDASQGSPTNRFDQVEDFTVPEDCLLGTQDQSINNFMIFPNPSEGDINIVSRQDMGESTISIYDINGRIVFSQNAAITGTVNIQAGNLKPGVYIIKIEGDNYTHNSKLIIR